MILLIIISIITRFFHDNPANAPSDEVALDKSWDTPSATLRHLSTAPNHQTFNELLSKYVDDQGKVNYQAFSKETEKLDGYLNELSEKSPQSSWSRDQKLAYWINAYNAFTIKLILNNYPVKSITDIEGGKPWDSKWIKLGESKYSLNQIENEIIRPRFNEPRIHFAVNCAARSCPPLANQAFTDENLELLLQEQTKSFINDAGFNEIAASSISISKIFEWYADDFGNIISFLNKYSDKKIDAQAKVTFRDYNWSLNEQ